MASGVWYKGLLVAVGIALGPGAAGAAQTTPAPPRAPDFSVQVWGTTVADFTTRVSRYVELRAAAAVGAPPLVVTDNPDDITRAEVELARQIGRAHV